MRYLALFFLMAAPSAWAGSYYSCTDANGHKTFQSTPCDADATTSERTDYQIKTVTSSQPQYTIANNPLAQDLINSNRARQLDRDISKSEKTLDRLGENMATELSALRLKKSRANNNLAGAQWESSISEEMSAVTNKYKALMDAERDKLSQLRDERAQIDG